MAKTLRVDVSTELAKRMTEFFGECTAATLLAAVDYACRRKQALAKDATRHDKGRLPTRFYSVRLDAVKTVPKPLAQAVAAVERVAEKFTKNGNGKRS